MARYAELTIKLLFGSASTCAYPGCAAELLFRDRGKLTVVVQIAHIRSEKKKGPRHDPSYPKESLHSFENLLLLCGQHHPPVDQHESVYTVEELEEWKASQVAQTGTQLSSFESRQVIDQILQRLVELTEVKVAVELRGGRGVPSGVITGPLDSLMEMRSDDFNGQTYIVVQVSNVGYVPVTVSTAGVEYSYQAGESIGLEHRFDMRLDTAGSLAAGASGRLPNHSESNWCCRSEAVFNGLREAYGTYGTLPSYVRPFAELGPLGRIPPTKWLPLTALQPYLLPRENSA
ncbi:hypothetical protein AB0912_11440 [Streptomyces sp. NPDC007084]|uniref:hypothetical protein n=1 Tax=Streptomyces sp. NPDC007084 TaxID=3154313 RepID=UPI003455A1DC